MVLFWDYSQAGIDSYKVKLDGSQQPNPPLNTHAIALCETFSAVLRSSKTYASMYLRLLTPVNNRFDNLIMLFLIVRSNVSSVNLCASVRVYLNCVYQLCVSACLVVSVCLFYSNAYVCVLSLS